MQHIMVVCVGNICRSPLAEALLKSQLPGLNIWSAGLHAMVGHSAEPNAAKVAQEHGLDLSGHRAQQLTTWMCTQAELILVMERRHQQQIAQLYPFAKAKTLRLGEFDPQGGFDVGDPYMKPIVAFHSAYALIAEGVNEWVRRIKLIS